MSDTPQECAREVLDVTPIIIQAIRFEMRSLRKSDLSVPQFRTLSYIQRNPGASLSSAAEFIGLTLSSMSILVNGLVDRGLVRRATGKEDRRRVQLTLTHVGNALLTDVLHGTETRLAEVLSSLTADECNTVIRAMELLRPIFQPRAQTPPQETQSVDEALGPTP